ncbi:MAG: sulfatase [Planctomycetaceae bacterium]|nr:sulfatase [Planctomycetaceae bacterium]
MLVNSYRFVIGALALLALASVATAETAQPNFLIFIADDMAWDDCGAYGHPYIRTPNIDRLAEEGMRFDRAYLTCSSCSPSRCSILTGRYPHATGAAELHMPLPAEQVLIASPLREAGYYTAAVGKWHLGNAVIKQFDLVKQGGGPGGEGDWLPTLKDRPKDKPFFFWFAATDPHRDYAPGAVDPPHEKSDTIVPPIFPDTDPVRGDLALYYDEISRFDEFIGLVLQELEEQGVADNTFVLVISDNGRPFPRCKTTVYEDGVHTPFIVRYPQGMSTTGEVCRQLVSSVDIVPTVLELAGQPPLASHQGKSFAALLKDVNATTREACFSEHNWHDYQAFERGVVTSRFRYVRNWQPQLPGTPPADAVRSPTHMELQRLRDENLLTPALAHVFTTPRPEEELYDITVDPHCLNNLADKPAYAKRLSELKNQLADWQARTQDAFPGTENLTPDGFDRETGLRVKK